MPKTKVQYNNQIKFNASEQFVNYIRIAMASNVAEEKFGKHPTQTEFIRGVIYQWIRKHTPHILIDDLEGNVPEILEHKALKDKHKANIKEIQDYAKKHFEQKKYEPTGFNIGVNNGVDAGQTIMHMHIHLIPRYHDDVPNPRGGVRGVIPSKQDY